jgi:Putative zinc-finger
MSEHVRDRLDAYLDEELSAGDRAEISRHLSGCSECRRLLEELAAVDEAARELPAEAPEGYFDTFAPRVRERLRGARARRAFRPPIWSLAVAAALLLAVITPLTLREHATPPPATPAAVSRVAAPAPTAPAAPEAKDRTPATAAPAAPAAAAPAPAAERDGSEGPPARLNVARSDRATTDERKKEAVTRPANTAAAAPGAGGSAVATAEAPAKPQSHAAEQSRVAEQKVHLYVADQDEATPPPPAPLTASAVVAGAPSEEGLAKGRLQAGVLVDRGPAVMNGPAAAGEARYRSLQARTASNAEEARALRGLWRAFATSPLAGRHADDARVAAIEAAARAYAYSHSDADRAVAETDARDYLARKDAPQAGRVGEIIAGLDR